MLFLGDLNLPDEYCAHLPAISVNTFSETWESLTTNNFTKLLTEVKHEDVLELICSNYDDPEILCIEMHPFFQPFQYFSTLFIDSDCRPYSLSAIDIQTLDIQISASVHYFDPQQSSENLLEYWLKTFETILNKFLLRKWKQGMCSLEPFGF